MNLTAIAFLLFLGNCCFARQFTEEEYIECFDVILCKLNKSEELRIMLNTAGPKLVEKGYRWFAELENMHNAADTDEFWENYPGQKCGQTDEMKRDIVNYWIQHALEHWTAACQEDPTGEECKRCDLSGLYMNNGIYC